jgi:hypothetical protein
VGKYPPPALKIVLRGISEGVFHKALLIAGSWGIFSVLGSIIGFFCNCLKNEVIPDNKRCCSGRIIFYLKSGECDKGVIRDLDVCVQIRKVHKVRINYKSLSFSALCHGYAVTII